MQGGGGGSTDATTQTVRDLKKSIEELKKEQEKVRLEQMKESVESLRYKALEQKINELRRTIEEMKHPPRMEPRPFPLPELPAPRGPGKELPAPRGPGTVLLRMPAGALLIVNDTPVPAGPSFQTPPLEPNREYTYHFEATVVRDGQCVTKVQSVSLRAGAIARLNYEDMASPDPRWTKVEEAVGAPARITVRLPEDARLTVHGVECPLTSGTRAFDSPALVQGKEYFYNLKTEVVRNGRAVAQTRRVAFRSGQSITVSFDDPSEISLAAQ
jgi:uncharacterized protein (TIGR03000 family)